MIVASVAMAALAVALRWRPSAPRVLQHHPGGSVRRGPKPTADTWASFLDAIAGEVRGGASLSAALTHADRLVGTPSLATVRSDAPPDRDTAVVLQVIEAAAALGGPVAATLDSGASVLRERSAARADLNTHAAQGRISARVLTAVPLSFAGLSLVTSDSFRRAFLSPAGLVSAAVGGTCNAVGWWWMRHLIAKASP